MTAAGPHIFWITSRAAGTAALMLASASVAVGLLASRRGGDRRLPGGDAKALHEVLSLTAIAAIVVHGATLLGDHYLHPTLLDLAVPFTGAYRPFWTGLGIIGGWGLIALGLSYYARTRIGAARWRALHRFTALFWLLGLVHTLGGGTDAGQLWFLLAIAVPAVPAFVLLTGRLLATPAAEPRPRSAPVRREREVAEVGAQPLL